MLNPSRTLLLRALLVLGVGVLLFVSFFVGPLTQAAPSSQLNFQGRLLNADGSLTDDGNYHVEFKLYDQVTGGVALWTETYTGGNTLRVANGYFTANLGGTTPFPSTIDWGEELWLTINIGGNSGAAVWDGEMTPRTKVTATPYAFRAGELQGAAGGYTADELVQIAPTNIQNLTSTLAAVRLNQTGTGSLLQLQGDGSDTFTVAKDGSTSIAGASGLETLNVNGAINFGNTTSTNAGTIRWTGTDFEGYDGTAWVSLTSGSGGGGGSTNNQLIQAYDGAGGTDLNTAAGLPIPWTVETRKDTGFTHNNVTNNTRIVLDDPGWYQVSYNVSGLNGSGNRNTVYCRVRMNGTTFNNPSGSYAYSRNNVDAASSNTSSIVFQTTAANEYYEIICSQSGSAGTHASIPMQSWTVAEKLDVGGGGSVTGAFVDGGNSFGANAILGTNDTFGLSFETDGAVRFTIDAAGDATALGDLSVDGGQLDIGTAAQSGALVFSDGTSNTLTLQTGALASDLTFTLPTTTGSNGECLTTDGTGVLSFASCGGGGSGDITDGGNTTGSDVVIGTNDGNNLSFETNNVVRATIGTDGDLEIAGTNTNVDSRLYIEDAVTSQTGFIGTVVGPYTFDADNDADEAAWTFVSTNGTNGLLAPTTNRAWTHQTADTPSAGVGPTSGQGGPGDGYVYTEASAPAAAGDTFTMTHNVTLDASATPWEVEFYWNQRGDNNLATVQVQTNENGAGWVTRGTYGNGGPDVPSAGVDVWNQELLDMTGLISGTSTQLRFLVTLGSVGNIWNNDFGLDSITIRDASSGFVYGDNLIEGYNTNALSDVDLLVLRSDVGTTGNVKFRVDSDGDVFSDGTNNISGGADIAENYLNSDDAKPGDVVYFVDNRTVAKTTSEYQAALAGVISTDAAVVLDASVDGVPVGLKGRVPTRVSIANGEINKGDYLTSGPGGTAVKALASGNVIGTAMESTNQDAVIDVFIGVSYYTAPLVINLDGVVDPLTNEVIIEFTEDEVETSNEIKLDEDGQPIDDRELSKAISKEFSRSNTEVITDGFSSLQLQINNLKLSVAELDFNQDEDKMLDLLALAEQWQSGEISGALSFDGEVSFLQNVTFVAGATFNGDTAGSILIETGETKVDIVYSNEYESVPYIQLTPNSFIAGQWRVVDSTETGFSVELQQSQVLPVEFNWHATEVIAEEQEELTNDQAINTEDTTRTVLSP